MSGIFSFFFLVLPLSRRIFYVLVMTYILCWIVKVFWANALDKVLYKCKVLLVKTEALCTKHKERVPRLSPGERRSEEKLRVT